MSIGLCCQYIEPKTKRNNSVVYKNIIGEKRLQYNRFLNNKYTEQHIVNTWIHNLSSLQNILIKINNEGYSSFRISSNLFPLFDSCTTLLRSNKTIINKLNDIGDFVKDKNIRLTTHPDQFVVISSDRNDVIIKSINILLHHAWVFDTMQLPKTPWHAINIHGGKKGNVKILLDSINKLPTSTKNRLTLENDERSYSVMDLMPAFTEHNIPICFDSHHHTFNNNGLTIDDALYESIMTWGEVKPLTHLSNTTPGLENGSFTERRKHSNYVHYIPDEQLKLNNDESIDIDFEFKMKNLAIQKAIIGFNIKL